MAEMRFEHRMSDSDSLMWTIEKDPLLRSTITAIVQLDRAPDPERFHALIERGTRLVPRMRQRVRANPFSIAPPRWETDPNFDLGYHIRWVRAGGDRTMRAVLDLAEPIAMAGFDRARPLWEMTVVDDLEDGSAAVIMKIHHAISDGVGAIKIALVMFELERDGDPVDMPPIPAPNPMSFATRVADAIDHERRRNLGIAKRSVRNLGGLISDALRDPVAAARSASEATASVVRMVAPATEPLSPLMTGRSLSVHFETIDIPLADARAAAHAANGTLNDAFLAATFDGFFRYHEHLGAPVEHLRLQMPINVRNEETADLAGNQFAPMRFPVPCYEADPIERMQEVHELVAFERGEPALGIVEPMARVLNRLPTSLTTEIFGSMLRGVDLVASNVPGAPFPIFTAGSRIESIYAFGPMAGAAANLTLVSYLDELRIGVNVDPAAVKDPALLLECLREGWDHVLKAGVNAER